MASPDASAGHDDRWASLLEDAPDTRAYDHHARPGVGRLLASVRLDAVYERAQGDYLWQRRHGELVKVLDLVGGYGANLFGHHHPDITAEARRLLDDQVPFLAQGSVRAGAARLAEALCQRLGDHVVIFTNSGTETVEAAIKHLHLERARPVLWAVTGAFHGKTCGAVQLTWSQHEHYAGLGPTVRFIDPYDPADWDRARADAMTRDDVAGAFIEPVQGEGGVRPLPDAFMRWLRDTCRLLAIPIVADEIQSGMGRTGTFLACEAWGIVPDYVCLSKALGGGLAKIGALLIRRERFQDAFAMTHTSTFAEDDWSARIALTALAVLDRDGLMDRCAARGTQVLEGLNALRREFPDVIADVRGRGLMLGIELVPQAESPSLTIRAISDQDYLGWLAAAWLLNVHDIRIAPTMSQPFTLRLEPSAYIEAGEIARVLDALRMLCRALRSGDSGHLFAFMVGRPTRPVDTSPRRAPYVRETPRVPARVAFVGYFNAVAQMRQVDPSLATFTDAELSTLIDRTSLVVGPSVMQQVHLRSVTGREVHLTLLGLDVTADRIARMKASADLGWVTDQIDAAVAMARDMGCQVVGLGGYTSSVTASCLRVKTRGIALTSGNSLAVGMGLRALRQGAERQGIAARDEWLGVVGVPGNIASIHARIMAPEVKGLVLVARNLASRTLAPLVAQLRRQCPGTPVEVTDSPEGLRACRLVVTATVGAGALVQPEHLCDGPVVVCDISVPSDVAPAVADVRPDVLVIPGGIVRLRGNEDVSFAAIDLIPGHAVACLTETLLMGLEGFTSHGSYGAVTPEGVQQMLALADAHGFELADIAHRVTTRAPEGATVV